MTQVPSKLDDLLVRLDADMHYQFAERAGIIEYDGGVDRDEAELLALVDLLRSHPGALLGLRFLRLEGDSAEDARYLVASDIDAAYDHLGRNVRLSDVDDPSSVIRESFSSVAVLAAWLRKS
jgi:hypothetical protein